MEAFVLFCLSVLQLRKSFGGEVKASRVGEGVGGGFDQYIFICKILRGVKVRGVFLEKVTLKFRY